MRTKFVLSAVIGAMTLICCAHIACAASYLYVSEFDSANVNYGRILRYDGDSGAFLGVVDTFSTRLFQLAIGPDQMLYVGTGSGAVIKYDPETGEQITSWSTGTLNAHGLAFDSEGNLYIAHIYSNSVSKYNPLTGTFIETVVSTNENGLWLPHTLEFDQEDNLYISTHIHSYVHRYDSAGNFIGTISENNTSIVDVAFLDSDDYIYAADFNSGKILRYNMDGSFYDYFITGLNQPYDIEVGPDNSLYVATTTGILRYNSNTGLMDDFAYEGLNYRPFNMVFFNGAETAAIPEPATIAMVIGSCIGIFFRYKRK